MYTLWGLKQREQEVDKADGEGVVESKKIAREQAAANMQLISDVCDLTIPGTALGYANLDDGIVGLAGTIIEFKPKPNCSADEQQSTQYSGAFDVSDVSSAIIPPDGYEPLIDHHGGGSDVGDTEDAEIPTVKGPVHTSSTVPVSQTQPFFQFQRLTPASEESSAMGFSYSKPTHPVFNTKPSKGPAAVKHTVEHPPSKLSQVVVPDTLPGQTSEHGLPSRASHDESHSDSIGQANDDAAVNRQNSPSSTTLPDTSQTSTNVVPETEYDAPTNDKHVTERSRPASPAGGQPSTEDEADQGLDGETLVDVLPPSPANVRRSTSATPSHRRPSSRQSHNGSSRAAGTPTPPALTKPRAPGKVQKPSRIPRTPSSPARSLQASVNGNRTPNPRKALRSLQMYYHNQEQYQNEVRAWKESRDMEIQDLETISQALHGQLQESEKQVISLTKQLAEHHGRMPKWQDRIKKLNDFVNGLSRDHSRLREDAKAMNGELTRLHAFQETIKHDVDEATLVSQNEHSRHQNQLSRNRQMVESLQSELNTQNAELAKESARLQAEQARTEHLEGSLTASTSQYQTLICKLNQREGGLSSQIHDLSDLVKSLHEHTPPTVQNDLHEQINECLSLLKQPRDPVSTSPASLEKLELSIQTVIDKISESDSTSKSNATANSKHLNTVSFELASKMQTVATLLHTEQPVKAQVEDLREAKATVNERLRATEIDLINSRLQANATSEREKQQSQRAVALEAELKTVRQHQHDLSLQSQRLHDAEKQCRDLSQQLGDRRFELQSVNADAKAARDEAGHLRGSLNATETTVTKLQTQLEVEIAEKARIQRSIRQQQDDSSLQSQRLHDAEKRCRDLSQRLGDQKSELQAAGADVKTARDESSSLWSSLNASEAAVTKLQAKLEVELADKIRIQTEAQENEKRMRAEASEAHRLESTKAASKSANDMLQLSWHVDQKTKELEEIREQKKAQDEELDRVQEKLRIIEHDKMITTNGLRAQLDNMRVENTALRAEKQGCENNLAAANEEIGRQQDRVRELTGSATGSGPLHTEADSHTPVDKSKGPSFEEFFMLEDAEGLDFVDEILDVSQEMGQQQDSENRALVSGDSWNMGAERRPAVRGGTVGDSQANAATRRIVEDSQDKWPQQTSGANASLIDESGSTEKQRQLELPGWTIGHSQAKATA
ncbi:MAG: hypothetical protein Q9174_005219 [Haloplaca sp. 1 TL-2023]